MDFLEKLRAEIHKANAEREEKEREEDDFYSRWRQLRQDVVLPLLDQAAKAFASTAIRAGRAELDNGGVVLRAGKRAGDETDDFAHSLTFAPDGRKREVICSASIEGQRNETFKLDHLTPSEIQRKIVEFAADVARGGFVKPPSSFIV